MPLLLIIALTFCPAASATIVHTIGIARDTANDAMLYIEHHVYLPSGEHRVRYISPQGTLLAERSIRYPRLPQHPEILHRVDGDRAVRIAYEDGRMVMTTHRDDNEALTYEKPLTNDLIIDAGFDAFIRERWKDFNANPVQRFELVVAGQRRSLAVEITRTRTIGDETTFIVRPRNWVVGLFVPEASLVYDADRRLVTYEGLTNLPLPGKPRVVIRFRHHRLQTQPAPFAADGWPQDIEDEVIRLSAIRVKGVEID
ncbi:MAG: hypothetical protein HUJ31_11395 [Pseudomonadales bacterium]|nr:hypothetical protein [Pseudomonadales bacterium]